VPALDRALALEQRHHGAVTVGHHLDLDVAGGLDPRLEEHGAVAERGGRLAGGPGHGLGQVLRAAHHPHAPPAAAGRRLDEEGPTQPLGRLRQPVVAGPHLGGGEDGHAGVGHHRLGRQLRAHRLDGRRGRADEDEPGVEDGPGEASVLGQEAVARVHGIGPGAARGLHQGVDAQVRLGGRGAAQRHGLVGLPDEGCVGVGVAVHGHGGDAHGPARAEHPPCDLAPVGDQQLSDHILKTP
jgi:hypothetical protein